MKERSREYLSNDASADYAPKAPDPIHPHTLRELSGLLGPDSIVVRRQSTHGMTDVFVRSLRGYTLNNENLTLREERSIEGKKLIATREKQGEQAPASGLVIEDGEIMNCQNVDQHDRVAVELFLRQFTDDVLSARHIIHLKEPPKNRPPTVTVLRDKEGNKIREVKMPSYDKTYANGPKEAGVKTHGIFMD